MVSSFAIHYGNRKTHDELLTIDPREREGGPVAMQLFGHDPEIMRSAAAHVAALGADIIDINMGCPVPKVMKTGAGAALLQDADSAVAIARAAREGSNLPVTVKLRAEGVEVAKRLVEDAGVAGHHVPPAHRQGPPQGHAGLRPRRPARAGPAGAGDRHRRHGRRRPRALGVRVHGLRGGHAGAREPRQPVAVRAGAGHARRRAGARGDPRRVGVGARPRGGASGRRPRRPLSTEIPPLVRRAPGRRTRRPGRACSAPRRFPNSVW